MIETTERQQSACSSRARRLRRTRGRTARSGAVRRSGLHGAGAFVTLHKGGRLRGCIGHVEADEPLAPVIPRCAVAAGSTDPGSPPVTPRSSCELDIELSLLGPLEPVAGVENRDRPARAGRRERPASRAAAAAGGHSSGSGTADTFVAQTCHKAGLAPDAWQKRAKLWRFEAEVFRRASIRPAQRRRRFLSSSRSTSIGSARPALRLSASPAASAGPQNGDR